MRARFEVLPHFIISRQNVQHLVFGQSVASSGQQGQASIDHDRAVVGLIGESPEQHVNHAAHIVPDHARFRRIE